MNIGRLAVVARQYARVTGQLALNPRAFVDTVKEGKHRAGIAPRTYFRISLSGLLMTLVLNKESDWTDAVAYLSPTDQVAFLEHLGACPGSTESISAADVVVCLSQADPALAIRFQQLVRLSYLLDNLAFRLSQVAIPPILLIGSVILYLVCRRQDQVRSTAMTLSRYFVGYYCLAYGLFRVLGHPLDQQDAGSQLAYIGFELCFAALLTLQFYRYFAYAYGCSKRRLTAGAAVSLIGMATTLLVLALAFDQVTSLPAVDEALREWASTA